MIWTVCAPGVTVICGRCLAEIPGGDPIALVTTRQLERCLLCAAALGFEPNPQEIDLERFRLEQERLARPVSDAAPSQGSAAPPTPSRPSRRMQPQRGFIRAADLAHVFDPKAAAAGDR